MTATKPHPTPSPAPRPATPRRRLPFDLSPVQLVATALAAITATVAASYLGVAGTVLGAALASVVTAVGKEVYTQSLRSTGSRVRGVVPVTLARTRMPQAGDAATVPSAVPSAVAIADAPPELPAPLPVARPAWRRVALGALGVFVAVLAVVTSIELVAGRPVSDLVRGDAGKGTSFFGGEPVRTATTTVPPTAPTVTRTVTPQVVVTTPTYTQTAPAVTRTTTPPASTPSGSPTAPTGSATSGPTASPTSSGTPTP